MNSISQLVARLQNRKVLITIAVALLLLNLFRLAVDQFNQRSEEAESRVALLEQYRMTTRKLDETRERVAWLETQAKEFESYLLTGGSEEKIISDVQIKLQEQIAIAGLTVESLSPARRIDRTKGKEKENKYDAVDINIRLSGTLNQFVEFLAQLYRSKTLFRIESFTLKPYKNKDLKIFLDFKGYYNLNAPQVNPAGFTRAENPAVERQTDAYSSTSIRSLGSRSK
jgi:hypothetical protein